MAAMASNDSRVREPDPQAAASDSFPKTPDLQPHSAHWGLFSAGWRDGKLVVAPHPGDPDPNPLIDNFPSAMQHRARVTTPMVRRGWLERGPGPDARRGDDAVVECFRDHADKRSTGAGDGKENSGQEGLPIAGKAFTNRFQE